MRQDRTGTRFEGQDRPVGPCYPRPALGARSGGLAWHRRGPAAGISADLPQPIRGPLRQRHAGRRFSGREGHRVQLADFRRSGTVEALTGHVEPGTPCPRTWSTPSPNQFGCTGPMRLFSLPACARSTRPGGLQEPFFANKAGQKRIGSPDLNYQNEDQKKAKPKPLK